MHLTEVFMDETLGLLEVMKQFDVADWFVETLRRRKDIGCYVILVRAI